MRWTRFQIDGALKDRCGSFARIGFPVVVKSPEIAQLFEAPYGRSRRNCSPRPCFFAFDDFAAVVEGWGAEAEARRAPAWLPRDVAWRARKSFMASTSAVFPMSVLSDECCADDASVSNSAARAFRVAREISSSTGYRFASPDVDVRPSPIPAADSVVGK